MELEKYSYSVDKHPENNLKDVLNKYLFNWKWFVLSIVICVILGFIYLRYQAPVYQVTATILIKDDKKGGSISDELSVFEDIGLLKNTSNIDNEIEVLKSRSLMRRVVNELNLDVIYYSYGRPIFKERFFDTPIRMTYLLADSTKVPIYGQWIVIPHSEKEFTLKKGEEEELVGIFKFGESLKVPGGQMIFSTTNFFNTEFLEKEFKVVRARVDEMVNKYLQSLKVEPVNKTSNAITISLRDRLPDKAVAIVDNLIKQHNLDAIADKNQVSKNTADFISERIRYITAELTDVEHICG